MNQDNFSSLVIEVKGRSKTDIEARLALIDQFTKRQPESAETYKLRADVLFDGGKFSGAVESYVRAINMRADYTEAYAGLAECLYKIGKTQDAVKFMNQAVVLSKDGTEFLLKLGDWYKEIGRVIDAKKHFLRVLSQHPRLLRANIALGEIFLSEGGVSQALGVFMAALHHHPHSSELHYQIGKCFNKQGSLDESIKFYKRCIELGKTGAAPCFDLAVVYSVKNNLTLAKRYFERALEYEPDNAQILGAYFHNNLQMCDWSGDAQLREFSRRMEKKFGAIDPFTALALFDDPAIHRQCSEVFTRATSAQLPQRKKNFARASRVSSRLRIGYFSADFRKHPVALLMARTFEEHDRSKFEVVGYGLKKPSSDQIGSRIVRSFCSFNDISKWSDADFFKHLSCNRLDIAVNLSGHTHGARNSLFARGIAPVQINYLGYPGTHGGDIMDYIIVDRNIVPVGHEKFYSEKMIFLPDHYQAQDRLDAYRLPELTRADLGIPSRQFVFCAFNNSYKITSREFDIWAKLLRSIDGSILWLYAKNSEVQRNLKEEARTRGLDGERVIFAKKMSYERYLNCLSQADLFLDTFTYNAGATASDALRVGLPVLTKRGRGYTARMASSLLRSIGLEELIVEDEKAYEATAIKLAVDREFYVTLKAKLNKNRYVKPLFDTKRFTGNLEKGYELAFNRFSAGLPPANIFC